ncbi:alpha-1,2-fucosyltransferase [Flavobacterium sp. MMLR14_040]|uniref:alpha-1,2-fucosyltransferase n=1 Tax=Flavobacterium sp. MMLR14_040 TaxID=3093843 RepID=UPI00298F94BD|nr:alpha-1,2-fucosyltransferase [Flavobacterium sp. MMLR14_040]MDW8849232.1 alpha-1,2-fucosyltransferase [Flavobacterium sp. MMLR14_040]
MITYSKIGKKGNLGNQLFQIASTIGLSIRNNQQYAFSQWKYQEYFKNKLPLLTSDFSGFINAEETEYNFHEWDIKDRDYDLSGWLQTEKYFDKGLTKHHFEFADSVTNHIKKKYESAFTKRTILLSIRRGDFVNHLDYFQLPINYYLNSLAQFFPNWQSCNLIVLSDDIKYCKFHFSFLENAFFAEDLNGIEQLCLGSLCDDFIISNSTFSWWTAWLGEKEHSKIIRPLKNFDGVKSQELNDKDYFPERWIKYNHTEEIIKLEDIVFDIKSKKNRHEIAAYISTYFDVEMNLNHSETESSKNIYVLEKDYFLPPLVIYSSYLKLKEDSNTLVVNNVVRSFKVSKPLNYNDFLLQKDFGLFSTIFSFSKTNENSKAQNPDIYLKRNNNAVLEPKESILYFSGGQFCAIGAYGYSFKKLMKRKEIELKRTIKKILSIK